MIDLIKPCKRKAYWDIVQPQQYSVETLRVFEAGNILEDYWVRLLEGRPDVDVLGVQVPAYYYGDGFVVHGRVDVLAQHAYGELRVHEVKTIKSFHYLNEPRQEHVEQIQFYMNVLGIDMGQIDYIDKNSLLNGGREDCGVDRSFMVRKDMNLFDDLIIRANQLYQATSEGNVPACCKSWLCDYCLHKAECDN